TLDRHAVQRQLSAVVNVPWPLSYTWRVPPKRSRHVSVVSALSIPVPIVVAIAFLHLEAGDLDQRSMIAGAERVVVAAVLDADEGRFAGAEEDESTWFGGRVADRAETHTPV